MVLAFNPDDPHDGHAGDAAGFTYRMVHIWPEYYTSVLGDPGPLPLFRNPVIEDPALTSALRGLHAALTCGAPELVRSERLMTAARHLARHASTAGIPAVGRTGTRAIAEQVRNRIHDGEATAHGGELTMDDLAAAAGCTRYAAYRAFRAVYGMPPSDYQRQLRVRSARRLLAAGVSPAAAAAEAGFADQPHLTRWFRRYYGVTPGVYQAQALRHGAQVLAEAVAACREDTPACVADRAGTADVQVVVLPVTD